MIFKGITRVVSSTILLEEVIKEKRKEFISIRFCLLYNVVIIMSFCTGNGCNMGTSDLPDMYAQSPRACARPVPGFGHTGTYQANHSCPCYN